MYVVYLSGRKVSSCRCATYLLYSPVTVSEGRLCSLQFKTIRHITVCVENNRRRCQKIDVFRMLS